MWDRMGPSPSWRTCTEASEDTQLRVQSKHPNQLGSTCLLEPTDPAPFVPFCAVQAVLEPNRKINCFYSGSLHMPWTQGASFQAQVNSMESWDGPVPVNCSRIQKMQFRFWVWCARQFAGNSVFRKWSEVLPDVVKCAKFPSAFKPQTKKWGFVPKALTLMHIQQFAVITKDQSSVG